MKDIETERLRGFNVDEYYIDEMLEKVSKAFEDIEDMLFMAESEYDELVASMGLGEEALA